MPTARDVLNELKWREEYDLSKAVLFVRGRTMDDVKRIGGDEVVEVDRRYFSTARATIPTYKIIRIEYEGKAIFERMRP